MTRSSRLPRALTPASILASFFATAVMVVGLPAVAFADDTLSPPDSAHRVDGPVGPSALSVTGQRRSLVISVGFDGTGSTTPKGMPGISVSLIANTIINQANPWFEEVSHGLFSGFSAARVGPVRVQPKEAVCTNEWLYEVANLADAASRSQGVEPNSYDTVVYYFGRISDPTCTAFAGMAQQHGRRVWLHGLYDLRELTHEFGHLLGLGHAGAQFCADGAGARVPLSAPLSTRCTQHEYGNAYSAMGSAAGIPKSYSSAELTELGWNNGRVATIAAGAPTATTILTLLEDDAPGTHALRLRDGATTLWVEYRLNPDEPARPKLLVSAVQPALPEESHVDNPAPFVLDMSPNDGDHLADRSLGGSLSRLHMTVGQSWTNPLGLMTIRLDSAGPLNATVTILSASPPPPPSGGVVPSVIGDTPVTATNRIIAAGLVRGTIGTTVDCESLGKVNFQSAVAGTQLPPGGVVDIKYGVQPPGGCGIAQ